MKMKTSHEILFLVLIVLSLFLITIVSMQGIVIRHEETHAAINKNFGIDSTININFLSGHVNYTYPENFTQDDIRTVESLQSVNELVSYQFITVYIFFSIQMIFIVFVCLLILLRMKK